MKDFFKQGGWMVILTIVIICVLATICITTNTRDKYTNDYFSSPTYVEIQKVYDKETGVYYYITSTGDIEVAVDIYGRPLIVDGGDGTAAEDPIRGKNPYAAQ